MRVYAASAHGGRLPLGKQGESKAEKIIFPFTEFSMMEEALLHQRSTDTQPYPVTASWTDDGLEWVITNVDTDVVGTGQLEIQFRDDDGTVVKTVTYVTTVTAALTEPTEDVPDPYADWYSNVLAASASAQTSKTAAAASATASANSASSAAASAAGVVTAEAARVQAEQGRVAAETARVSAESARASAETGRVTAETAREAYVTQLKADVAAGKFDGKDGAKGDKGDKGDTGATGAAGAAGAKGDKGDKGDPGSDAYVTSANIASALGYTPAKDGDVGEIKQTIANHSTSITTLSDKVDYATLELPKKLDKPLQNPTAVGKVLKVQSVNADGSFVCVWDDEQTLPDVPVKGVKVAGTAMTPDSEGNVNVPNAVSNGDYGVVKLKSDYGLTTSGSGHLKIQRALDANITNREYESRPITPTNLNFAVKAALTDSNAIQLDDVAKKKCCATLGAEPVGSWVERTITFSEDMDSYTIDLDGHKPVEIVAFCYMPTAAKGDSFFLKLGGNSGCIGRFNVGHATEKRKGVCRCTYSDGIWTSVNAFMMTSLEGLSVQRSYGVFQNASMNCVVCSNDFAGLLLASIDRTQIPTGTEIYIKYKY